MIARISHKINFFNTRQTLDFIRLLFRQHERPPAPAEGGKCRLPASDPAGERMSLQLPGQEMHRKLCLLLRLICSPSNVSSRANDGAFKIAHDAMRIRQVDS